MLFLGETFEKIDKVTITNVFWGEQCVSKKLELRGIDFLKILRLYFVHDKKR